jgi:hypothetical protein
MVWTNSGVFFHGLASPAGFADAIEGDVLLQQLRSSTAHGVRIQAEKLGQFLVAAMPELERFQAGVQAALLFIQQTIEQNNGGFQFVWGDFQKRGVDEGREGLHAAAPEQLALAAGGIKRGVEVEAREGLTRDPVLLDELAKGIVHLDVQGLSKFGGEIALGGMIHQSFSGGQQGALTREPDGVVGP